MAFRGDFDGAAAAGFLDAIASGEDDFIIFAISGHGFAAICQAFAGLYT